MNGTPTFNTLADVQSWLSGLDVGEEVAIGAANFVPPIASQVFIVLNGTEPLALTVTATTVTEQGGTLSGTGVVLDEAGCVVKLTFGASAEDPLLVEIEATLPTDYGWKPVMGFQFMLGSLVATVSPEPSVGTANFSLSGLLLVDGQPALSAQLTLPAVPDADWTLAAVGPVAASEALLSALAGGSDPLSIIGNGFEPQYFTVTDYELAFSADGSATLFDLGLGYAGRWLPLGSTVFEVTDLDFDFTGYAPFRAAVPPITEERSGAATGVRNWETAGDLQALASATLLLDDVPVEVSVKFPDAVVFASLDRSAYLSVAKVFDGFHIRLPARFPDVLATTVSFGIHARDQAIDLMVCMDEPVPVTGSIFFDNFHFDLGIDCRDGVFAGQGDLFARFSFGGGKRQTAIAMSGTYDEFGSLVLRGSAIGLSIADVVRSIVAQFDVDASDLPKGLSVLNLEKLTVWFEQTARVTRFIFLCRGTVVIRGNRIGAAPALVVTYDPGTEKWRLKYYRAASKRLLSDRLHRLAQRHGG